MALERKKIACRETKATRHPDEFAGRNYVIQKALVLKNCDVDHAASAVPCVAYSARVSLACVCVFTRPTDELCAVVVVRSPASALHG